MEKVDELPTGLELRGDFEALWAASDATVVRVEFPGGETFDLLPPDVAAFSSYSLRNSENGELLLKDLIRLGFFELPKMPSESNLLAWHGLFSTGQVPNDAPAYLQEAAKAYDNFSPQERQMLDLREKAEAIAEAREAHILRKAEAITEAREAFVRQESEARGEARGEASGRAEERIKLAKVFLQQGVNPAVIAFGTGLSLAEVDALKAELG